MSSETTDDADECKYVRDQPFAEECKEALRAAANDIEGEVTVKKYNRWAAAQSDKVPSQDQIERELEGTFYDVCDDLGIPNKHRQHTGDEMFSAVKQAADEVGEPLTMKEYENWRDAQSQTYPKSSSINARFGWSSVCEKVGVECGNKIEEGENEYTAEDICSAIRGAAADQGEPLTRGEYTDWRERSDQQEPSISTISGREGGWRKACERADVAHGDRSFSIREIEMAVQLAGEICGEPLSSTEYQAWQEDANYPYPSIGTIMSRTNWSDVCERVGVENTGRQGGKEPMYSEKEIITAIKQAASDYGEPLTGGKYTSWRGNVDEKYPARNTIVQRIGWSEACEQAGVSYGKEETGD